MEDKYFENQLRGKRLSWSDNGAQRFNEPSQDSFIIGRIVQNGIDPDYMNVWNEEGTNILFWKKTDLKRLMKEGKFVRKYTDIQRIQASDTQGQEVPKTPSYYGIHYTLEA